MWPEFLVCFVVLSLTSAQSLQPVCTIDADCDILQGGVCRSGSCVCPPGQQAVEGATRCADLSPYHNSPCVEDQQCFRLALAFQCRRTHDADEGQCTCQPNHHYLYGRCWRTIPYGEPCSRSEECLAPSMRDPFALACDQTCQCAEGYYERQRGECRKIGYGVGDGCVLDEDCQFEGGACNITTLHCYDVNGGGDDVRSVKKTHSTRTEAYNSSITISSARQHYEACDTSSPCPESFECSPLGVCLCPVGYYFGGETCLAELGSPSTVEQCAGMLAEVRDGICTCPANFFFEENMRDCTRVTRVITDSCVTDAHCATFGAAARCGEEQPPFGTRSCECNSDEAVWDANRQMCRLFVGIGESCEVDTDCMAGELEISCIKDDEGRGVCACHEGFTAVGNLCLTTGLGLGDSCQASQECTAVANNVCLEGMCACDPDSYVEEDGHCAPVIGGRCNLDVDCSVDNTHCAGAEEPTCQCNSGFIEHDNVCWPALQSIDDRCNQTAQCNAYFGDDSTCVEGHCECNPGTHYRDGGCWPVTDLFEVCVRTSQCYLGDISDRVVCRNSLCQCDFRYPYSEELDTCVSGTSVMAASLTLVIITIFVFNSLNM